MPYLFDGYNLYHAALKLPDFSSIVPRKLCALIAQDMQRLRQAAVVVFDGTEPRGQFTPIEPDGFVKLIYSGPHREADDLLEQLIQRNTAPRRLIIVSSDRRIQKAARRRRAKAIRAHEYLEEMIRRASTPPRPKDPPEKRLGVPPGQLGQWLDLFNIDPDEPPDELSRIRQ
ncbi:MAG: NYN domain-containing protein [Sedimentisphaerales bacterium]|nr:NYN domain-containing protein [Sedimentisphaerales bacterium]